MPSPQYPSLRCRMKISKLSIRNFKSFSETSVVFGPFTVIIGPNAAGKSNFVDVFTFLSDCAHEGFANAVSLQGGGEYIRNLRAPPGETTRISVSLDATADPAKVRFFRDGSRVIEAAALSGTYTITLSSDGCTISEEVITASCTYTLAGRDGQVSSLGEGEITLVRSADGTVGCTVTPAGLAPEPECTPLVPTRLAPDESILESPAIYPTFSPLVSRLGTFFRRIGHYDLDPRLAKRASEIPGMAELEHDGSNLALVLRTILADPEKRHRAWSLIRDLLPFIEEIRVDTIAKRSLIATVKERYTSGTAIPSFLLSDGTINLTALVVILYFEEKPVVIIEESERNIHPHLIAKLVSMMQDVASSLGRQVIVTTHHPEVVKYGGMESLLLLRRDRAGYSVISRASERAELEVFLENMGIDELYVQNLL